MLQCLVRHTGLALFLLQPSFQDFGQQPQCRTRIFRIANLQEPREIQESWYLYGCKKLLSSFQGKVCPPSQNASSCGLGSATLSCCRVENWQVSSKRHLSSRPFGLGGKYLWGFCSQGMFLCKTASVHPFFPVCTG